MLQRLFLRPDQSGARVASERAPGAQPVTFIPPALYGGQGASASSVRWLLFLVLAGLLMVATLSCTRDIGGVSSGWNAPVSANGVVYVGTKDGRVQKLIDNGFEGVRAGWIFPQAEGAENLKGVYSTPVVAEGLLYVAGENGYLYALELTSGNISDRGWRGPRGQPQDLAPLVAGPVYDPLNELVVVPSENGILYDFISDTGESLWDESFEAKDKIWSTPSVSNGVAYFGSHDHKVYAVNLATGKEIWNYETEGVVAGTPLVFNGMVIAGSFDKNLYALDAEEGDLRWKFEGGNWFWAGAVSNGEMIFAPNMDGYIYAIDRDGILHWQYDTGDSIVSKPVLVPRGLVVAPRNGRLLLLDVSSSGDRSADQRLLSSQSLGDAQIKAPLVAVGESVYVGSDDGSVRRVEVKGGQVQMWCWHYENVQCN